MTLNFSKGNGLVPAIVQNAHTLQVLMLGYMNEEAWIRTQTTRRVTFYSRTRKCLWTKGEHSGNTLEVVDITVDCDRDALLIFATPHGPTCHTGATSCFHHSTAKGFVYALEKTIHERIDSDDPSSYTNALYRKGINAIAQKVGEEAVELLIEAKDPHDTLFANEAADLLYHFLVLLKARNHCFQDIEAVLKQRS